MPLLDTRDKADNLVGRFISDVVLQLLSFVAENERQNIRARQAEGIALAKQRGISFGRPKKKYTEMFVEVTELYIEKKIALSDALDLLDVRPSTFYYHLHKLSQDFQ